MKKDVVVPRTIEGDWDWRETRVNRQGEWVALENSPADGHIWRFIGDNTMSCDEGDRTRSICESRYDPDNLLLTLKGFYLDDKGEPQSKIVQTYRVEFPAPSEMYLYELDDDEPGAEESLRLTLTLRKI